MTLFALFRKTAADCSDHAILEGMDDLVYNIVKNLVTQGIGFSLAAVFAYIAYKKDQQLQRLSQRVLRSALTQSKDQLRQEQALATLREVADRKE